jgi:serine/threonine protein kinase
MVTGPVAMATPPGDAPMPRADAARDLLFGLLALQTGLIDQAKLVAAFHAWTLDKSKPLADHLIALGHLNATQRDAIEALSALHVEKHGDPEKSLAALGAGRSTRESLAGLGDPEVNATLARVGPGSTEPDEDRSGRTLPLSASAAAGAAQRFRVLRPHARGGLGEVFVALDSELNREVALKQILNGHADDPSSRQRFLLEAEITGGLEHPGIVPVYGLGRQENGRPFYAMRFVKGESLKEAIRRFHEADDSPGRDPGERSLLLRQLLGRFVDVCNTIAYAHSRGVLHRDLKPGNVLLGPYGETLVVDWGLAKVIGRPEADGGAERTLRPASASEVGETRPGSALGTPAYMSPEMAQEGRHEPLGPSSDVYCLGGVLYTLMTGRPPVQGDDLDEVLDKVRRGLVTPPGVVKPGIPLALEAICLKALTLNPGERYPSAGALAADVERWLADEPILAFRAAVAKYDGLVKEHPKVRKYREGLGRSRTDLGNILHVLGRYGEAEEAHRAAIEDYKALVDGWPLVTDYHEQLAGNFVGLGKVLTLLGREVEAQEAHRAALSEYHLLSNIDNHVDVFLGLQMSAELLQQAGGAHDPSAVRRDPWLRRARRRLARDRTRVAAGAAALILISLIINILNHLVYYKNYNNIINRVMAEDSRIMGDLYEKNGDRGNAVWAYGRSRDLYEELLRADPTDVTLAEGSAVGNTAVGLQQLELSNPGEAIRSLREAVTRCEQLVRGHPDAPRHRRRLAYVLTRLAVAQKSAGNAPGAVARWRQALEVLEGLHPRGKDDLFDLACYHAGLSGALAGAAGGLDTPASQAEADRAMAALRQAVAAGYRDAGAMKSELESLRGRPDFQLLLLDLSVPAEPFAGRR